MYRNCKVRSVFVALAIVILGAAQANATNRNINEITQIDNYTSGYIQGGFKVIPATNPNTKYCALSQKVLNGNLTPYSDCTVYQENGAFYLRAVSNIHAGVICSMTCFRYEDL